MDRPKRKVVSRCLEYNNGMLHEEELALRRALHASLVTSKTQNDEDSKPINEKRSNRSPVERSADGPDVKKQQTTSNTESIKTKARIHKKKRKSDERSGAGEKKRQKLLIQIKPRKEKSSVNTAAGKDVIKKKSVKSKTLKEKKEGVDKVNDGKVVKKRRKRKKYVDEMRNDDSTANESLPKVHVQRKFAQTNPTSPRSLLLYQSQMQPMKTRAKTEDFLDFLCLRGTQRMTKSLEIFNNPCAPVSPLTDDEESTKTTPSKASTNENDDQPDAKRNLANMLLGDGQSSSSSGSLVSSPVSTRVQSHIILPQFTDNHGVLTHIPTPIPYPTPPIPTHQAGVDEYGAPTTTTIIPSLVPNQPRVSVMQLHITPLSGAGSEKQGFHPVTHGSSPQKSGETSAKVPESPAKPSPNKRQNEKPSKSPKQTPQKSPNKDFKKKLTSPEKSSVRGDSSKTSKNLTDTNDLSVADGRGQCESTILDGENNDVPVFSPTEIDFKNPIKYIESIKSKAEPFGICVIVPPKTWRPEYCLSDEIRFTTKLQRIHCLAKNYPSVEYELAAIKKHLEHQNILLSTMPQIAGCEVDLVAISKVVAEFGGLQQIIDKRKWGKVADKLRIPKTGMDRATKLQHVYWKYLLPYDLLSEEEKKKLREDVLAEHNEQSGTLKHSSQEYQKKGRPMNLAIFQRNAKNMNEYIIKPSDGEDIEKVFWQVIDEGRRYVVVYSAELEGTAFPTSKTKAFYKSKWNLNVLPKTPGSLARDLPDVEGITSPMVKVEMVLSAETWHTTPHSFYTVEYLHEGEEKIWYSIPCCDKDSFLEVVKTELDGEIDDMGDRMIPHSILAKSGIAVHRIVQEPGKFIIKFPGAYHSSLSTGFCVSEFVSVAPMSYVPQMKATFQEDMKTEVNHLFSWESLIVSSVKEELRRNSSEETLNTLVPELKDLRDVQARFRSELATFGVVEKSDENQTESKKSRVRRVDSSEIQNCNECNRFCFPSVITYEDDTRLCLHHGLEKLKEDASKANDFTLTSHVSLPDLNELVKEAEEKLEQVRTTTKVRKRQVGAATGGDTIET